MHQLINDYIVWDNVKNVKSEWPFNTWWQWKSVWVTFRSRKQTDITVISNNVSDDLLKNNLSVRSKKLWLLNDILSFLNFIYKEVNPIENQQPNKRKNSSRSITID